MRALAFIALILIGCTTTETKTIGSIERIDPALDKILYEKASIEILGEGYTWSEGPVWVEKENMLLFSDVPENIVYKWTAEKGVESYLTPSGFTGDSTRSRERGSNGLILHHDSLILCQHGNRQVAKMNASLKNPKPEFIALATNYNNKRFNSPNDAAYHPTGDLFFTDPPYGLGDLDNDIEKDSPINGVYKVTPQGVVSLMIDSLTKPNGIAFMPNGKKFLVANSDGAKAIWYEFELNDRADSIKSAKIFYNATDMMGKEKGAPDGFKIDSKGNVFATGPGGIWVFNPEGKVLGKIKLPEAAANCALSPDEKTLFITADMYLLRVKLRD